MSYKEMASRSARERRRRRTGRHLDTLEREIKKLRMGMRLTAHERALRKVVEWISMSRS